MYILSCIPFAIYNTPACVLNNRLLVAVIIAKTANCYSIDIELFMNRGEHVIDICDLSDIGVL